ncbi:lantibiotic immunity ABC transporter MutG family permease subunit [Aneurinibacillus migulanus]|uniref:ABC-2 type transport system permease protein n=1 Tax=Aneurinibacillus migulanus TaxID=47500 RepID=A0A0D1WBE0_ANEMI|nr:lantibiotic immunity ABC transporter MutG family permease subunit [Aneurinibacillus migulanus]KIV55875.1 lantibiotic ABC transporter permease [Aneurinibacillus migulanus]KON97432.1 lantibiotic ABC transporter permease [Aneurinibacillus migulanus]MED1619875.1 lantibiotic immunity ABC transporter MutG family permease subunit [Aneurinibacillus migulanus]SDK54097.1 ABC-2 type transport system permease protein [Aneurinibacillus migulanus]GED17917.1 multidrug ABC transporter permease [Aneurinibac
MTLFRVLSSDWLKTKRTAVRLIIFAAPVAYAFLLIWYFGNYKQTPDLQSKIYEAFFQMRTALLPVSAGLLAGFMGVQEEHAGNFNGILGQTVPRAQVYISKLLMLILMTTADMFISTFILLVGMEYVLHISMIQVGLFVEGMLLAVTGSLFLYTFHLFLGFAYGLGASIAAGGAGFLIAAIIGTTTVGDRIWQFVPWAWSVRLSQLPEVFMPGLQLPDSIIASDYFTQLAVKGLVPAIATFILVTVCGTIWFFRWEGRKAYE